MLVGRILWFKLAFDILLLNRAFRVMNSLASTRFCLEKGRNLWLMCGLLIYPLLDYSSNWFLVCLSIFVWLLIFTFPLLYAIINTPLQGVWWIGFLPYCEFVIFFPSLLQYILHLLWLVKRTRNEKFCWTGLDSPLNKLAMKRVHTWLICSPFIYIVLN